MFIALPNKIVSCCLGSLIFSELNQNRINHLVDGETISVKCEMNASNLLFHFNQM